MEIQVVKLYNVKKYQKFCYLVADPTFLYNEYRADDYGNNNKKNYLQDRLEKSRYLWYNLL